MKQTMDTTSRRGYSLTELVIVIGVVAATAAILLPVFSQARISEQRRTSDRNIRKVGLGVLEYLRDNDEKFPRSGYDCRGHNDTSPSGDSTLFAPGEQNQCGGDGWQDAVGPYVGDPAAFVSPLDKSAIGKGPWGGGTGNDGNPDDGNFSLVYNDLLAHRMPTKTTDINAGYADPSMADARADGLRITDIKTPSQCLLIAEGHGGWDKATNPDATVVVTDWTGSTDLTNKWHQEMAVDFNCDFFLAAQSYSGLAYVRVDLPFNGNGGNVVFTDGHEKFMPFQNAAGQPVVCRTLSWTRTMDPQQRKADIDSCNDPNNPVAYSGGWTQPNWF
jgi:type II secretory pathway pseudopilin PulG